MSLKRTKRPRDLQPVTVWVQMRSDIQQGYLSRLIQLLRMHREYQEFLTEGEVWLINRSIYAYILECIDNGVKDEAYEALRRYRINFRFFSKKHKTSVK